MEAQYTVSAELLGDSCWPEAALSAYGALNGGVSVHIANKAARTLYEGHPHIRLADEPGGKVLDCSEAWWWSMRAHRYFADGYWPQLGLEPPGHDDRTVFRVHSIQDRLTTTTPQIVLCPFARACGLHFGRRPDKTLAADWWEELVARLDSPMAITTLGGLEDPPIAGTTNVRGVPLKTAAEMILRASLLVTVETWAGVVAGDKRLGRTLALHAGDRRKLTQPPGSDAVWAMWPDLWSIEEIVDKFKQMIG